MLTVACLNIQHTQAYIKIHLVSCLCTPDERKSHVHSPFSSNFVPKFTVVIIFCGSVPNFRSMLVFLWKPEWDKNTNLLTAHQYFFKLRSRLFPSEPFTLLKLFFCFFAVWFCLGSVINHIIRCNRQQKSSKKNHCTLPAQNEIVTDKTRH